MKHSISSFLRVYKFGPFEASLKAGLFKALANPGFAIVMAAFAVFHLGSIRKKKKKEEVNCLICTRHFFLI